MDGHLRHSISAEGGGHQASGESEGGAEKYGRRNENENGEEGRKGKNERKRGVSTESGNGDDKHHERWLISGGKSANGSGVGAGEKQNLKSEISSHQTGKASISRRRK
jgi:hypothetical protein